MSTVKSILRKDILLGRIAARKPFINERNVSNRLNWCKTYSKIDPSLYLVNAVWNYSELGENMSSDQREPDSMTNIPPNQ